MRLVIYGDFNCPFSAVASARAAQLEDAGRAEIDWRAVVHDLSIPRGGGPLDDATRDALARELDQIAGLLTPADTVSLRLPPRRLDTRGVTDAFAALAPEQRSPVRRALFEAYWSRGEDIGSAPVLRELTGLPHAASAEDGPGAALAEEWRSAWLALPNTLVPMMVLPDGYVSRGLGALRRLAELRDG
ncbi:MAG TPA: DsbA family protein [Acidimicrobiales bacterium]